MSVVICRVSVKDTLMEQALRNTTTENCITGQNICFKVTRPSYFVRVPSYFEALWYPHSYFDRKSNI